MRRQYSRDFLPPAPTAPLLIARPGGRAGKHLEGKIDSGADVCGVPEDVIAELDLQAVRVVRAAGFAGKLESATLYHCAIEFAGHRFDHVEALPTRRRYVIVGRNVLRELVVRLDGPKDSLTVTSPSKGRGRGKPR